MKTKQACGGVIEFSRLTGNCTLFGTPFYHHGYIELRIYEGEPSSFSRSVYHPKPLVPLVKVRMSFSQFSELITTLNTYAQTPCTLIKIGDIQYEPPQIVEDEKESTNLDVNKTLEKAMAKIESLIEAIESETMSKKAKANLIELAKSCLKDLRCDAPYYAKEYAEYLDRLESQAKTEISAYADLALYEMGMNALTLQGQGGQDERLLPE
jgi:hypothetical protein